MKTDFTDSLQVEESFYQAFQSRNIDLMKNVWDDMDEAICIHPGAQRIYSYELILASWEQIFSAQAGVSIVVNDPCYILKHDTAIHYVKEELYTAEGLIASVLATNIYHLADAGWKMIAHHASPATSRSGVKHKPNLH